MTTAIFFSAPAMLSDRLKDDKYLDWIRTSLSLYYLKEGLVKVSQEKAELFHNHLSGQVVLNNPGLRGVKCTKCTFEKNGKTIPPDRIGNTWKMNCSSTSNVCSLWLREILPYHEFQPLPKIAWANSNPQAWPSDAWEVAKLFQPFGCKDHSKAEDSDCTALLSLIVDCRYFRTLLPDRGKILQV